MNFSVQTNTRSKYWKNSISLFDHAIKQSPESAFAIELNPDFASSYMSRGIIEMNIYKDFNSALDDYNRAIVITPGFVQAYYNRGLLKFKMNNPESACNDFYMVRKLGYPNADDIISRYCR